jgi:organic hydroperoxide reductase OsmC/OhrA
MVMPVNNALLNKLEIAHQTCIYSKATRGNIDVAIKLV